MHAYAAGCLDHEDLIPLLELINSDGDITNPDLGELQNLASLLPAILLIENPPASAKDNIAKKLYAIREEVLAKRTLEREIPLQNQITEKEEEPERIIEDEPVYNYTNENRIEKTEEKMLRNEPELLKPERFIVEKPDYQPKQRENRDSSYLNDKKESKATLIALVVIFILLIAGAASGVYYVLQQKIETQEKVIAGVRTDIDVLNDEIIRLNKIQRILAILGSKDVNTINLDGTIDNPVGFGKIVFDAVNKEGLLSLFNMPILPKDKSYQLWLISKGQPFSLGTYIPKATDRYIPLNEFPDVPSENIEAFIVTLEDVQGADSPKGTVYLSSAIKRSGS